MPKLSNFEVSGTVIDTFPVFDTDGFTRITGLAPASFTPLFLINGVPAAKPFTIFESGSTGYYNIQFTTDQVAHWAVYVENSENSDIWFAHYEVIALPGGSSTPGVEQGFIRQIGLSASLNSADTLEVILWVNLNGLRQTNYDSMAAQILDLEENLIVDLGTDTADTTNGFFAFTTTTDQLERNKAYVIVAQATIGLDVHNFNTGVVRLLQA